MKRLLIILTLLGIPILTLAQSTTVTATVIDSNSTVWINGTIFYTFQGNGSFNGKYQWQDADLPSQYLSSTAVPLNSSAFGTFTVPDSNAITPAGSSWKLSICPNASTNCVTLNMPLTGSSEDISDSITSFLKVSNIAIAPIPKAYTDSEITTLTDAGGLYYNTGLATPGFRYYDGSSYHNLIPPAPATGIMNFNFTAPSPFSATGSPCTTSGCTIGFNIGNQAQGTFYAGPSSGSGQPIFRTLAISDIPAGLPYIPSSTPLHYQTITSHPQEPATNFSSSFTVTDNSGVATNVDIADTGAAAGSYNCPNPVNINSKGQITGIATGPCPTAPPTTTCNANGCFVVRADGITEEFGISGAFPTGGDTANASVTFPLAFSSTTNLVVTVSGDACAQGTCGSGNKSPLAVTMNGDLTTSGFTCTASGVTPTGGGGNVISNTVHCMWHALQHN